MASPAIAPQNWPNMAHLGPPSAEVWISYSRALELCNRTTQWLSGKMRDGGIRWRKTDTKLANGRTDREILLSTLPPDAQKRYAAAQAKTIAPLQAQLFGSQLALVGRDKPASRVFVPTDKREAVSLKQTILQPILAMRDDPMARRAYSLQCRLANGQPVDTVVRMCEYQVEQYAGRMKLSVRTLMRWVAAVKAEGEAGLARKRRDDAGRSRYFEKPEHRAAAALVAYLHLGDGMTPGLSVQQCFDLLCVQRERVGLTQDDLPHYDTVLNFLASTPAALRIFATRGRKEFAEDFLPYISRAYREHANEIWVSDTMIADVEVMNDCIPGAPLGAPVRLRLTAIIDYRSRYVVGYSWAWEGSSASITTALRHAIQHAGPCDLWYADNGKDYVKVAKGAVPGYMLPGSIEAENWVNEELRTIEQTGVLARLGIRSTHCLPHHPQSKHVERFFRTLHLTFCKLWPTYTGGKPSERPDQTEALMHVHRSAMRHGDLTRSHHPLASEFMARFEQWLPTYHNKRGHRGRGMGYRSPAEVFYQERSPQRKPTPAAEDLARLLMDHKVARVNECQIRLNKLDYTPTDALGYRLMLELNHTDVIIAFDPLDPSQVAVVNDAGQLVTMLERKQLVRQAPEDPETQRQIAAMMQTRGALSRGLRETRLGIIRAGKSLGVTGPLQMLDGVDTSSSPTTSITPRKPTFANQSEAAPTLHTEDIVSRYLARSGGN